MNSAYYKELQKKQWHKNLIFTVIILLFAITSTYHIYNKFVDERDKILKSESLDVTFHDKNVNKFSLTKITPVSDNVGLSSKAYRFTIKNNTNKKVKYSIKIIDDEEKMIADNCLDNKIPLNIIKIAIHKEGEVSDIYTLDDLDNKVVLINSLDALEQVKYTIRFWISNNSLNLNNDSNFYHYHGKIEVKEVELRQ